MKAMIKTLIFIALAAVNRPSEALAGPLLMMDSFSARNFSLAQSDVAVKGDLDSAGMNPAGLARMEEFTAGFYYLSWFEEMQYYSIAAGMPVRIKKRPYGALALNMTAFSVNSFPNYDENGSRLADLDVRDSLFTAGYGLAVSRHMDAGLALKVFRTHLGTERSGAFVFDAGLIDHFIFPLIGLKPSSENLDIGISLQNISFQQKYLEGKDALPRKIRTGFRYLFFNKEKLAITGMLSVNYTKNLKTGLASGLELSFLHLFLTRFGYRFTADSSISFTCGAGLEYSVKKYRFILDYALIPLKDLGIHHAVSFKVQL